MPIFEHASLHGREDTSRGADGGTAFREIPTDSPAGGERQVALPWPRAVALDVDAADREHVLRAAAALVCANQQGLDAAVVFRALSRREQAASTALGLGFSVPHARVAGLERPVVVFVRTQYGIDFDAPDGKPVANFLVIIVPPDGNVDDHLLLLSNVSQMAADRVLREQIAAARTPAQAWGAFSEWIDRFPVNARCR